MHCLTLVQGLGKLEEDDHVVSVNFRKLEHLDDILVNDLVVMRFSVELCIVLEHLKGVLSSRNHQWEVFKLCDEFSRGFSKTSTLKNLIIEDFGWSHFIFRIVSFHIIIFFCLLFRDLLHIWDIESHFAKDVAAAVEN